MAGNFDRNLRLPHIHFFYMPQTWDKRLYFPSEGRRAEDFFALKNPKASAGFEPANLGTKGQHSTSRLPKPLRYLLQLRPLHFRLYMLFYLQLHVKYVAKRLL